MARQLPLGELTPRGAGPATGVALATRDDDAEIRALLRRAEMPGAVRVAFTREPDAFACAGLAGSTDHAVVHRTHGKLDGVARASVRVLHRNGVPRRIGYLAELRLDPGVPGSPRALRDGYELLRSCLRDDGAEGCFTSIAEDNLRARRVLEHGTRFGLPRYSPLASLVTLVVPVGRPRARDRRDAVAGREELSAFLQRHAAARQLTLTWDDARWDALARHGLGPGDFRVVREGGRIVAAGAAWDQRAFKQAVVCGYAGALKLAAPIVGLASWAGLVPPLPRHGSVLPLASVLGAFDDDASLALLWDALRASAGARGIGWLAVAHDAADPRLAALQRVVRGRAYRTRLYDVRWDDSPPWDDAWDGRPFAPEVSLL